MVDDGSKFADQLRMNLPNNRYHVTAVQTESETLRLLGGGEADIVLLCTEVSGLEVIESIEKMKSLSPLTEIIILTRHALVDLAVRAMKAGAYDYITKPVKLPEFCEVLQKAFEMKSIREKAISLENRTSRMAVLDELVGESEQMEELKKLISIVGPTDMPVLILGETGSGKELVARAIHIVSNRSSGPFVTIDGGTLPENIFESEVFGHRKEAFTGAHCDKNGLLQMAHQGTCFIDEVGDIGTAMQAKLLRAVETGTFRRLGDMEETRVDLRFVCTTSKDLEDGSAKKSFRADLFYRLSTFTIRVPPLRERQGDISLLIDDFLSRNLEGGGPTRISVEARRLLTDYSWPGNVRELLNTLVRAVILAAGDAEIRTKHLPFSILEEGTHARVCGWRKNQR